jgi:hypothetical protein
MTDPRHTDSFASQLLRQEDGLSDSQYREYREKLERALEKAMRRERLVYWVCAVSCVVMVTLSFVGGSKVLGDFDPWSKGANFWSVTAGVVYVLATILFFLSLASYYSRFRPATRDAGERLRDASILELQQQVRELRKLITPTSPPGEPNPDKPQS